MSPEIRMILTELVEGNGELVFDSHNDCCKACCADSALSAKGITHEPDCIIERAKKALLQP